MKGWTQVVVVTFGLIAASAAVAAPAGSPAPLPRIVCDTKPRLEGLNFVFLSTDRVGAVQVVGSGEPVEGDDTPVMDPKAFCAAHDGIDTFILPAPRLIDNLPDPERDRREELEPVSASPRGTSTPSMKPVGVDDKEEDEEADDGDAAEAGASNAVFMDAPGGSFKSLPMKADARPSCDASAAAAPSGFMWILLPLLFGLRCRRGSAR
jgi:hypothetical protein